MFVKAYRHMSCFSVTTWNSKKHLLLSAQRTTRHVDQMNLWSEYPDCYISGYSINFNWPVLFLCVVIIIWCLVCFDSWSLCPGWFFIFIMLLMEHLQMLIVKPSNVQFQQFFCILSIRLLSQGKKVKNVCDGTIFWSCIFGSFI